MSQWSWYSMLEQAQSSAKEMAIKAQEIAEVAGKVAQEKASELATKAQELRQNYDVDGAANKVFSSMGVIGHTGLPLESPMRPSYADMKTAKPVIHSDKLDLVYITENIIGMAFPCDPKKPCNADGGNDINQVAKFLKEKHNGKYMVWNISEESYDYSLFNDQVLEYKFPGHPAPPLGMLFKICTSIESWLDADENNVAVVHCLTGKGRTAAMLACILTWIGEFTSPTDALQYVADRKNTTVDHLTIPSQQRYVQYFSNMLDGVKPRPDPLLLRRVIINSTPIYGECPNAGGEPTLGCCPYIQIFKCGRLMATAVPFEADAQAQREPGLQTQPRQGLQLKWANAAEGGVSFNVDVAVQGDLLLRCRHADPQGGVRISMFRAAFHTGYVPSGVLRLSKAQLDGAHNDSRYGEDFFIDLIFAPIEKSPAVPVQVREIDATTASTANSVVQSAPNAPSDNGIVLDPATTDKYELSLHRDARFWDAVASRKLKAKRRRSRRFATQMQDQFSIADDSGDYASPIMSKFSSAFGSGASSDALLVDRDGMLASCSASSSARSGPSDLELIEELANIELDLDSGVSSNGSSSASAVASSATSGKSSSVVSNSSTKLAPVPAPSAVDELAALEELERELGLESLTSSQGGSYHTPTSSKSGIAAPSTAKSSVSDTDLDNLEELENYLNSLSSK